MEKMRVSYLQQSILSLYNLSQPADIIYFVLDTILKFIDAESISVFSQNNSEQSDFSFFWRASSQSSIEQLALTRDDLKPYLAGLSPHHACLKFAMSRSGENDSLVEAVLSSSAFYPMRRDDEEIGSLQIIKNNKQALTDKEEQFLATFLAHAGQALSLVRQQRDITREVSRMTTIANINEILVNVSDTKQASDLIVKMVSSILRVSRVSLLLLEPGNKFLVIISGKGLDHEVIKNAKIDKENVVTEEVVKNRRPLFVTDIEKSFSIRNRPNYYNNSFITYPIIHQNRLLGTLNISNKIDRQLFNHDDLTRLSDLIPFIASSLYNMVSTAELEKLAITYELSQLYNRRYFYQRLTEEFQRAKRYQSNFSLIIADLDGLKEINDIYGHLVGDNIIKVVGERINKSVRDIDCVARIGGDEFVIICPKANANQARLLAERVRLEINQNPISCGDSTVQLSISCGVASYPVDDTLADSLVEKADEALYQAKTMGGNQTRLFGSQSKESMDQIVEKFSNQVINTPLKVRLTSFYQQNPTALHHLGNLSKVLGVNSSWLKNDINELVEDDILEMISLNDVAYYSLTKDEYLIKQIDYYFKNYQVNKFNENSAAEDELPLVEREIDDSKVDREIKTPC